MWGYFMIYSEISTNNNMIWFCLTMAEFTRLHSVEIIILVAANMKIDDIGAHTFRQTRRPKSRNIFEVPHAVRSIENPQYPKNTRPHSTNIKNHDKSPIASTY